MSSLISALMQQRQNKLEAPGKLATVIDSIAEKNKEKKTNALTKQFIQEGDYTAKGIQSFAEQNNLGIKGMFSIIRTAKPIIDLQKAERGKEHRIDETLPGGGTRTRLVGESELRGDGITTLGVPEEPKRFTDADGKVYRNVFDKESSTWGLEPEIVGGKQLQGKTGKTMTLKYWIGDEYNEKVIPTNESLKWRKALRAEGATFGKSPAERKKLKLGIQKLEKDLAAKDETKPLTEIQKEDLADKRYKITEKVLKNQEIAPTEASKVYEITTALKEKPQYKGKNQTQLTIAAIDIMNITDKIPEKGGWFSTDKGEIADARGTIVRLRELGVSDDKLSQTLKDKGYSPEDIDNLLRASQKVTQPISNKVGFNELPVNPRTNKRVTMQEVEAEAGRTGKSTDEIIKLITGATK